MPRERRRWRRCGRSTRTRRNDPQAPFRPSVPELPGVLAGGAGARHDDQGPERPADVSDGERLGAAAAGLQGGGGGGLERRGGHARVRAGGVGMTRIVQISSDGSRLYGLDEDGALYKLVEPHWVGGQGTIRVGNQLVDQREFPPGSMVWAPVQILDLDESGQWAGAVIDAHEAWRTERS